MSVHVYGMRVDALEYAHQQARSVCQCVTLVDDNTHYVFVIDPQGRVIVRPEEVAK